MTGKPTRRPPWNKGKLIGAKPPLRPSHVWSIRTKLQIEGRSAISRCSTWRSTASCAAATSSPSASMTLRRNGYALDRATVRQKKTGRPVRFELTDQTRQAIDEYLRLTGRKPGQFLFAAGRGRSGLQTRQYARLVRSGWPASG